MHTIMYSVLQIYGIFMYGFVLDTIQLYTGYRVYLWHSMLLWFLYKCSVPMNHIVDCILCPFKYSSSCNAQRCLQIYLPVWFYSTQTQRMFVQPILLQSFMQQCRMPHICFHQMECPTPNILVNRLLWKPFKFKKCFRPQSLSYITGLIQQMNIWMWCGRLAVMCWFCGCCAQWQCLSVVFSGCHVDVLWFCGVCQSKCRVERLFWTVLCFAIGIVDTREGPFKWGNWNQE